MQVYYLVGEDLCPAIGDGLSRELADAKADKGVCDGPEVIIVGCASQDLAAFGESAGVGLPERL